MNHLAHFLLSGEDEALILGNFIADFVNKKEAEALPIPLFKGVLLHRAIDVFTDQHPTVRQSTRRLHAVLHKYSPVVVDVLYDYFLSKHWDKFAHPPVSRPLFIQKTYHLLTQRADDLPPKLQLFLPRMIADDWLSRYATFEGLDEAFARMKRRVKFDNQLEKSVEQLKTNYQGLEEDFLDFFPQLWRHMEPMKKETG